MQKNSLSKIIETIPGVESNEFNISPFKFRWAIGMSIDVDLVNLTTRNRNLIAYAFTHTIILYDYVSKDMTSLQGHQNAIRSLSASRDGKWLFSADYEDDCVCIIWDTETGVPICSLFNPHGNCALTAAQLSPDAKFLVTVGNEQSQIVKFWLWTYGKDDPDATAELLETRNDRVKKISFNDDFSNEFLLTLNCNVIFISWTNGQILELHHPKISAKKCHQAGNFNDSSYIPKSHRAMTVTSNGFVLVWSEVPYTERFEYRTRSSNKKRFLKSVPLQKKNLTRIENHKDIIVIGNISGELHFYDYQLKLLYWCKDCGFGSIASISFDRESEFKRPDTVQSESIISESKITEEIEIFDTTDEDEIFDSSGLEENENIMKDSMIETSDKNLSTINEQDEKSGTTNSERSEESLTKNCNENSTKMTKNLTSSSITINIDYLTKNSKTIQEPADFTLHPSPFVIPKFFISSASGTIARFDVTSLKCRIITHPIEGPITAIATRPKCDYVITGNSLGILSLYKYTNRSRMVMKKTPELPSLTKLLNIQKGTLDTTYVTCPQIHESLIGVSVLRFSPAPDGILACGLDSGVIWMLHPDTLDPYDPNPYKHSSSRIIDIIFTDDGKYFAYSDDAFTVGVFRKNEKISSVNLWNFLGKYHSHYMPIRQILFVKPFVGKIAPRLLSLGEDQNLVEYDLENSGPYPEPGLQILQTDRVERGSMPLCMAVYPEFSIETFLITANSEHKFRLINDQTKAIRVTILGPTFGDPVQQMILARLIKSKKKNRGYMIFATSKEIGLLMLPCDGNPYRMVAMIGHPKKIILIAISHCGRYLFTLGKNDRGILMWRINYKSVDTMERLGGEDLMPFYGLIDGGKDGWLVNEMKDLFYYCQILQQGENTTATRIVTDRVSIMQVPNLMRAVGFYPTNHELETMMEEISYNNYADTGQILEEMTFEDFIKLYVNHRPAFGITKKQFKEAFKVFATSDDLENTNLTSDQFLEVLYGRGGNLQYGNSVDEKIYGEPLTIEEAHTCLRRLTPQDEDATSYTDSRDDKVSKAELNFDFLPPNISYKTFTDEILGVETTETSKDIHNRESLE